MQILRIVQAARRLNPRFQTDAYKIIDLLHQRDAEAKGESQAAHEDESDGLARMRRQSNALLAADLELAALEEGEEEGEEEASGASVSIDSAPPAADGSRPDEGKSSRASRTRKVTFWGRGGAEPEGAGGGCGSSSPEPQSAARGSVRLEMPHGEEERQELQLRMMHEMQLRLRQQGQLLHAVVREMSRQNSALRFPSAGSSPLAARSPGLAGQALGGALGDASMASVQGEVEEAMLHTRGGMRPSTALDKAAASVKEAMLHTSSRTPDGQAQARRPPPVRCPPAPDPFSPPGGHASVPVAAPPFVSTRGVY